VASLHQRATVGEAVRRMRESRSKALVICPSPAAPDRLAGLVTVADVCVARRRCGRTGLSVRPRR
jgi:hypothetical protein